MLASDNRVEIVQQVEKMNLYVVLKNIEYKLDMYDEQNTKK